MITKTNIVEAFTRFDEQWSPKIAGRINEFAVKLAKLEGDFIWHHHEEEDELFWVISGRLTIKLRDQADIVLEPGEFAIIPAGVEHLPTATTETHVVLLERASTRNTGNRTTARTVEQLDHLE